MTINFNARVIVSYFLIYLIIFTSGTLVFNSSPQDMVLIFSFVCSALAWWVYTTRELSIKFVLYLLCFGFFLQIVSFYTNNGVPISTILGIIIKFLFVYFVIAVVGARFLEVYAKIIIFLAAISIVGFVSDQIPALGQVVKIFPFHSNVGPSGKSSGYEGFFYMYQFHWHLPRNNSIFFEPGAYQFYINSAIYILLFYNLNITKKYRIVSLLVLLVAMATTQSTTGYLVTCILLLSGYVYSRTFTARVQVVTAILGVFVLISLIPVIENVVIKKLEHYSSIESIKDKRNLRSFDLKVDTEIIKRFPLGLGYEGYSRAFSTIGSIKLGYSSTNGVTKIPGIFGLPFAIFYFGSILVAFFNYNKNLVVSIAGFVGVGIFLYSEGYFIFSPIILLIMAGMFFVKNDGKFDRSPSNNMTLR